MSVLYGLLGVMENATQEPMTTGDVGALFGVSPQTVKRWADDGRLPFFLTVGGHYRFNAADVEALRTKTP